MSDDSPETRILATIRAIPHGRTSSYGEVARRAGLPRRARLVARVLAQNDDPDLPWHRVLRADGRIAFPAGSRGHREQTARLKREGLRVEKGRVRVATGEADIDALLWGPAG
jgi:methylated-DNA-protein-cysteine methyltransferase related protein